MHQTAFFSWEGIYIMHKFLNQSFSVFFCCVLSLPFSACGLWENVLGSVVHHVISFWFKTAKKDKRNDLRHNILSSYTPHLPDDVPYSEHWSIFSWFIILRSEYVVGNIQFKQQIAQKENKVIYYITAQNFKFPRAEYLRFGNFLQVTVIFSNVLAVSCWWIPLFCQ